MHSTPVQNQMVAGPVLPKTLPLLDLSLIKGTCATTNNPFLNPIKNESKLRLLHSSFKFNTTLPQFNQTLPQTTTTLPHSTITLPQSNATLPLHNKCSSASAAARARHQHSNLAGSHQRRPGSPESVSRWFGAVHPSANQVPMSTVNTHRTLGIQHRKSPDLTNAKILTC